MASDLHQRARDVLAQLSIVSEGTATPWDVEGHGQAGSRTPIGDDALEPPHRQCSGKGCEGCDWTGLQPPPPPGECPPESRSLLDHWRCRFARAWYKPERLLYLVLLAEEKLRDVRKTRPPTTELPRDSKLTDLIATSRGSPAEVAARFARHKVTMAHVRTVRQIQRRDPESGTPWLWPPNEKSAMSDEARERLKAEAQEVAERMADEGMSQKRISQATGIPRVTLQRLLEATESRGTL